MFQPLVNSECKQMKKISSQKCLKIPRAVTPGAVGLQPGDVFRHFYFGEKDSNGQPF